MFYWIAYALLFFLARPFSKITFWGRKNISHSGPIILAANHQRFWDIPLVAFAAKRRVYFMAKSEFFENKLKAIFLKLSGAFPIRREKLDLTALSKARAILQRKGAVVIFPEGKLNGEEMKGGVALIAARTNAPIVPIWIIYESSSFFPKAKIICGEPILPEKLSGNRRLIAQCLLKKFQSMKL